ncbi:MAG: OmpH family outer membrane protein [Gemmatimonadota bacterium]
MRVMKAILPVLLGLFLVAPLGAQTNLKIGYIDSQAILDQDPSAQAAQQQFEASLATYQAEVQQMGEDLQQLIDQYDQQQAMLSDEAKANREEEIRLKQGQYQQRISELEQQASVRQAELVEPVMERITAVIEEIRAEGSYSMIFDVAAQGIISADPALDLTAEVVRRLQAAHNQANAGGSDRR